MSDDGETSRHTDRPVELDLTAARSALDGASLRRPAELARSAARDYLRARGFVSGGELLDLDATYLAAAELSHVADHVSRTLDSGEPTEAYLLSLLAGADDGDRPAEVPEELQWARSLAAAEAVEAYRRDVARWLAGRPPTAARPLLDRLRAHERRVEALDGEVASEDAEALVAAARAIGRFLREGDDVALDRASAALDELG